MQVNVGSRNAAIILLNDRSLDIDFQVSQFLQRVANAELVPSRNIPLVSVWYDIDDDETTLEIEEIITLREYLCKIYGEELGKISIPILYGEHLTTNVKDWEAEWVINTLRRPTEYGYWKIEKMYENFDFVKEVDRFIAEHGPFNPEKHALPTKQDIENFIRNGRKLIIQ